jgi:hypothetical protein
MIAEPPAIIPEAGLKETKELTDGMAEEEG